MLEAIYHEAHCLPEKRGWSTAENLIESVLFGGVSMVPGILNPSLEILWKYRTEFVFISSTHYTLFTLTLHEYSLWLQKSCSD